MNALTIGLGGPGVWVNIKNGSMTIYVLALCFDLFAACCSRTSFPSFCRLYFEAASCGKDSCVICADGGRHVDPTCLYTSGCIPDTGVCFCYMPCCGTEALIENSQLAAYLEASEPVISVCVRVSHGKQGLPSCVSEFVEGRNDKGEVIPIKGEPWQLLKIDPGLSRLILLSCPVLKKIIVEHIERT